MNTWHGNLTENKRAAWHGVTEELSCIFGENPELTAEFLESDKE